VTEDYIAQRRRFSGSWLASFIHI